MSSETAVHFRWSLVDGVVVVEVATVEINRTRVAQEWAEELRALLASKPSDRYVLDFRNTEFMSSTAFAVVVIFNREVGEMGGKLAACEFKPEVRICADILSLGRIVPIFLDLKSALASFA